MLDRVVPILLHSSQTKAPAAAEASSIRLAAFLLRCGLRLGILAAEALDTACGIHQLLLAGKERVAGGADFEDDVALVRGAGLKVSSAGALDIDGLVLRVNSFFWHGNNPFPKIFLLSGSADRLQR